VIKGLDKELSKMNKSEKDTLITDIAASFQEAAVDVLVNKTRRAFDSFHVKSVLMAGGVAANNRLRDRMQEEFGDKVIIPAIKYCTDNAAMVAMEGVIKYN
jgi:N6-L-threonylcarbamoyladenine synthase